MPLKVDFLVIGSGIAGLSYALKVADFGSVLIITKSDEDESNTKYAQGGIAAVTYAPDSHEKHINDTLESGDGLCDEEIVRIVVSESSTAIGGSLTGSTIIVTVATSHWAGSGVPSSQTVYSNTSVPLKFASGV